MVSKSPSIIFTETRDISGEAEYPTKLGVCEPVNIKDSKCVTKTGTFSCKCVEKQFSEEEYDKMKHVLETYKSFLSEHGPSIYHMDDETNTIYMEYIDCPTVKSFVSDIDITDMGGKDKFVSLLISIGKLVKDMKASNVCHNDFHSENVLVCENMNLKIIDFDGIEGWKVDKNSTKVCGDLSELIGSIIAILSAPRREIRDKNKGDKDSTENYKTHIKLLREIIESVPDMKVTSDRAWRGITRL